MKLSIKRAYDKAAKTDGTRVLIDRLWPRGVRKADAHIDIWAKDLAPSNALRSWFHADPEKRYASFATKYRKELLSKKASGKDLIKAHKHLTLITAAKDIEHSHVLTLVSFLKKL
jgi:uncharacterized protein YeaO (DUF488 family)